MKVALLAGLLASLTASAEARPFASAVEQFAPLVHQARHKVYQGRIRPKLGVVSFNVAGVPLTRHRGARLEAITERLRETGYSIAFLQEVWVRGDVDRLKKKAGFPYHAYAKKGLLGSGLLILSKFPIVGSAHITFSVRARGTKDDWIRRCGASRSLSRTTTIWPASPV